MLNFIQHLLSLNSWKSKKFVVPKQTLQLLLMAKYKALGAKLSAKKKTKERSRYMILSSTHQPLIFIRNFLKVSHLLCLAASNSNKLIKTRVKVRKTPIP